MNILIVGLGSMGKRRIRLIQDMYPDYKIYGIDQKEERRSEVVKNFHIRCFNAINKVTEQKEIDCAFICTSPLSHHLIITECLNNHWNVFSELNLVDNGYKRNMELAYKNKCKLFLSSTFLYREEIKYIKSKIQLNGRWNYIYHIGQYLPDWHPWENYKNFFIGDKRTNGCREIMAIELPWLISAFGDIVDYTMISDKITDLDISFDDNYMIQFTHKNGNKGVLVIDVVSPCAVRRFEAYGESKYIRWNGTPESLFKFNSDSGSLEQVVLQDSSERREGYQEFVVENAYRNEIKEFFEVVLEQKKPIYGFEQDMEVLNLIDRLEKQS